MAVFFAIGFVVGGQLGVMPNREVRDEMLFKLLFIDEGEAIGGRVQSMDVSALNTTRTTSESTVTQAVHMSIRYPGEPIHFFTFY